MVIRVCLVPFESFLRKVHQNIADILRLLIAHLYQEGTSY